MTQINNKFFYLRLTEEEKVKFCTEQIAQKSYQYVKDYINKETSSDFERFLSCAFNFYSTEDGPDYWWGLARNPDKKKNPALHNKFFIEEITIEPSLSVPLNSTTEDRIRELEMTIEDLKKQIDILTVNASVTENSYVKYLKSTLKLQRINKS